MAYSANVLGNGRLEGVQDVLFVDFASFDKHKTREIAQEVDLLNRKLSSEGIPYLLIGPGRWGTRDPFLGIPVVWSQISGARVIVEYGDDGFPLEASLGSHFFHNVVSQKVGYFGISSSLDIFRREELEHANLVEKTHYLQHIRFSAPLSIGMDGNKRLGYIARQS